MTSYLSKMSWHLTSVRCHCILQKYDVIASYRSKMQWFGMDLGCSSYQFVFIDKQYPKPYNRGQLMFMDPLTRLENILCIKKVKTYLNERNGVWNGHKWFTCLSPSYVISCYRVSRRRISFTLGCSHRSYLV